MKEQIKKSYLSNLNPVGALELQFCNAHIFFISYQNLNTRRVILIMTIGKVV